MDVADAKVRRREKGAGVTVGKRFAPRKKSLLLYSTWLVKPIAELTMEDLQGENPDLTSMAELIDFCNLFLKKHSLREMRLQ